MVREEEANKKTNERLEPSSKLTRFLSSPLPSLHCVSQWLLISGLFVDLLRLLQWNLVLLNSQHENTPC